VKVKFSAAGGVKVTWVKPTWKAGSAEPLANTWTRSGM
jgi:hypothetical protein